MNFLEQVAAEWFSLRGYFVKTNLKFGKLPVGGWAGEMDVLAFHPQIRELVHIETSSDALSWKERCERFRQKFGSSGKWGGAASQRQAMETAALCKPWKNK